MSHAVIDATGKVVNVIEVADDSTYDPGEGLTLLRRAECVNAQMGGVWDGAGAASSESELAGGNQNDSGMSLDFFCNATAGDRGVPDSYPGVDFNPQPYICIVDSQGNTLTSGKPKFNIAVSSSP